MPPKPRKPPPRRPGVGTRNRNLLIAAAGAVAVVAVLVVVSVVVAGGGSDGTTTTTGGGTSALFAGIPQQNTTLGSANAPVTLIQFEDLQCPICREYQQDGFSGIVDEYVRPGKVRLRFGGLAFLGSDSEKALSYVLAAGRQNRLWQYADALYANQGAENSGWVTDALLERLAGEVGLDWDRLQRDAAGSAVKQEAEASAAEAARLQVPGTPSFFVQVGNQQPYHVQPSSFAIDEFRKILDDALGQ